MAVEFETKELISHETFSQSAQECLNTAESSDSTLDQTMDAARLLLTKLSDIENGALVVEPPLSDEEHQSFKRDAQHIVGIGEKALQQYEADKEQPKVVEKPEKRGFFRGKARAAKRAVL